MFNTKKVFVILLVTVCANAGLIQNKYGHKISHPAPKKLQDTSAITFPDTTQPQLASSGQTATSSATYSQQGASQDEGNYEKKDYYEEPKYNYKYGVNDPHSGDKKLQEEHREGDHTTGQYSLVEPDGSILTVEYSVIGKSGFNAKVHRTGHPQNNL